MRLLRKRREPTLRERAGEVVSRVAPSDEVMDRVKEVPGALERLANLAVDRAKPLLEDALRTADEAADRAKPAIERARKEAGKRAADVRKEAGKRGKAARKRIEDRIPGRREPSRVERAKTPLMIVGAATAGAGLVYFLDPVQGPARRAKARDRTGKILRRTATTAGKLGQRLANRTKGAVHEATPNGEVDVNDPTLAQKVESEILGDPDFPKGRVNVSAENGTIVLKGELDDPEQARRLEEAVRRVDGVRDVENLITNGF